MSPSEPWLCELQQKTRNLSGVFSGGVNDMCTLLLHNESWSIITDAKVKAGIRGVTDWLDVAGAAEEDAEGPGCGVSGTGTELEGYRGIEKKIKSIMDTWYFKERLLIPFLHGNHSYKFVFLQTKVYAPSAALDIS